jgi:hypothetical protein
MWCSSIHYAGIRLPPISHSYPAIYDQKLVIAPLIAIALTKIHPLKNYDLSSIKTISSHAIDLRTTIAHEVDKIQRPEQLTDKARLGYD